MLDIELNLLNFSIHILSFSFISFLARLIIEIILQANIRTYKFLTTRKVSCVFEISNFERTAQFHYP